MTERVKRRRTKTADVSYQHLLDLFRASMDAKEEMRAEQGGLRKSLDWWLQHHSAAAAFDLALGWRPWETHADRPDLVAVQEQVLAMATPEERKRWRASWRTR